MNYLFFKKTEDIEKLCELYNDAVSKKLPTAYDEYWKTSGTQNRVVYDNLREIQRCIDEGRMKVTEGKVSSKVSVSSKVAGK